MEGGCRWSNWTWPTAVTNVHLVPHWGLIYPSAYVEQVLAMKDVHLPFLMCMELCTAKSPGKIIGYQDWTPDAFGQGQSQSINGLYVEGVSLTHGRNPRKHIWTFAAALHEIGNVLPALLCPCTNRNVTASATPPPCFVGTTTSVILVAQSKLIPFFMVMIHCGMEQVVDFLMTAVISSTLLGF